jgi:hypothetical protein
MNGWLVNYVCNPATQCTYPFNTWWPTCSNTDNILQRLTRVRHPSKKVLFLEANISQTHSHPPCHQTNLMPSGGAFFSNPSTDKYPHHRRIGNHVFVDGHVDGITQAWAVLQAPTDYSALIRGN